MQRLVGWGLIIAFGTFANVAFKLGSVGWIGQLPWWQVLWPLWCIPAALAGMIAGCWLILAIPAAFRWLDRRSGFPPTETDMGD